MIVKQNDIDRVFDTLREKTGARVRAVGTTKSTKLDLVAQNATVEEILNQIAIPRGWTWIQLADGSYEMLDKQGYTERMKNQVIHQVFPLHFIDAEELQKVVEPLLTPEIGSVAADTRSNKLIVTDLPSKIALVEGIIREYDVQLYTRIFQLKNAKTEDIAERLDEVKSKSAEMIVDPANHIIIVKDTFDKIKIMEQLVEILDREQEMRVYNMNNIGLDGDIAQEFVDKFIKPVTSDYEGAVLEFNKDTSKLFVRDVRGVQEKILQILKQVDSPRKQVLIEGEILQTGVSDEFTLGTEWTFSHDLNAAMVAKQPGATPFNGATPAVTTDPVTGKVLSTGLENIQDGLPMVSVGSGGLTVSQLTDHVKAQLTATLNDSRTRLLLRPRVLIANNMDGKFEVVRNEPVLQTYFTYNNYNTSTSSNNNSTYGQSFIPSGLQVSITPHISNRGLVEMDVEFVNSTPIFVPKETFGGNIRGVGTSEESATTYLIIPSGETRVIGGLISRNHSEGSNGVPYLSRLPGLGFLFGTVSKTDNLRNLMFFITPTIIEERSKNDLLVEPVNEVARLSMEEAKKGVVPPENLNEIPLNLRPYLEEIRPEVLPMPDDQSSTATVPLHTDLGTTMSQTPATEEMGSRLLQNVPYTAPAPLAETADTTTTSTSTNAVVKVGGAVQTATGAQGPSGVFGSGAGTAGKGGKGLASARKGTERAGTRTVKAAKTPTGKSERRSERRSRRGSSSSETRY